MLQFLGTREWRMARRGILLTIVLVVAVSRYGGNLVGLFNRPDPKKDIEISKAEFRTDVPTAKPIWIIRLRNASRRFTYDAIQLEANYFDKDGKLLQKDKLVVHQQLDPLQEKQIASPDFKERPDATSGTLTVMDAQRVK
jgi:hypothetical protein